MKNKTIVEHFRKHFFPYILIIAVIISGGFSYYRFMIKYDYLVGYEGVCDQAVEKCFIGCEDDACTTEYYYTKMQKYEPDLFTECGVDITDCENANVCLLNDRDCSITFCDEKTKTGDEECTSSVKKSDTQGDENNPDSLNVDTTLQDNTNNNK